MGQNPFGYIIGVSIIGCTLFRLLDLSQDSTITPQPGFIGRLFVGLIAAQAGLLVFYTIFIYPFFISPFRHLPTPKGGLPLVGHGLEIVKFGPGVMAKKWLNEIENDGVMRVLYFFNQEFILVNSQQALCEILVKQSYQFEKPNFVRQVLAFVVGWGLLTVEGEEHKRQRRHMLPAFSFRHIKDLYPIFWDKACEAANAMTAECQSRSTGDGTTNMEIGSWSTRSGLDIIGIASAGIDFGAIKDVNNPLAQNYFLLSPSATDSVIVGLWAFLPSFIMKMLPISRVKSTDKAAKYIRGVCQNLIREKRRKLESKEDIGVDILSVALTSGLFSEKSLVDQMMTFLTAGHETTAAALTWSIYQLSKYPHIQERLRNEVRKSLPSPDCFDTTIMSSDIDSMPYLNAVCNEVLRTHCPITETSRISNCDTMVQGHYIPHGTLFVIPIRAINTDPQHWGPDVHEFKPERWLTPAQGGISETNAASGGTTSNYSLMTFLHGPHSCIGEKFSRSELACLLAAWIGRFSFEIKDKSLLDEKNLKVHPSVVAKPENGLHMLVKVVEGW